MKCETGIRSPRQQQAALVHIIRTKLTISLTGGARRHLSQLVIEIGVTGLAVFTLVMIR